MYSQEDVYTLAHSDNELGTWEKLDDGSMLIKTGNICVNGKHYRMQKVWIEIGDKPAWDVLDKSYIAGSWRADGIADLGYRFTDKKEYVTVYHIPTDIAIKLINKYTDDYKPSHTQRKTIYLMNGSIISAAEYARSQPILSASVKPSQSSKSESKEIDQLLAEKEKLTKRLTEINKRLTELEKPNLDEELEF